MRIIDADALMRDIEHYHLSDGKFQHWVEVQPTIEERKTGRWGAQGECPFCGYLRQWEDDKFCGNCGAKMEGEG